MGLNNISLFLCVLLCACNGAQEAQRIRKTLDGIGTCLSARPDSALAVLRAIDPGSLKTKKDRARAALLHSIALDKCYVDITSDSILAPALAYYRHHGTADLRLKARYYRAVLARNAGDRDTQMIWLVEAERFIPRAHDPEMAGFIYAAKRELFLDLLDTENAYKNALLAIETYREGALDSRYVNAIISLTSICQMRHQYGEAAIWIDTLRTRWDQMSTKQRNAVYPLLLGQADTLNPAQVPDIVNAYLTDIQDSSAVRWAYLADTYHHSAQLDKAKEALLNALKYNQVGEKDPVYLLVSSRIEQAAGNYLAADSLYSQYNDEMAARRSRAIHSSARFEQEREQLKRQQNRMVRNGLVLAGILAVAATSLLLLQRRNRKISSARIGEQQKKIQQQEAELKQHKQHSKQMEPHLRFLFSSYADHIHSTVPNLRKDPDIQRIVENRKQFLSDLETLYKTSIPSVEVLTKAGLTRKERDICYLFGLGLSSKEVLSYLDYKNERTFYNTTATIRHKLNLSGTKTDLQQYIRDLLLSS